MGLLNKLGALRGAKIFPNAHEATLGAADTLIAGTGGGMVGGIASLGNPNDMGGNIGAGAALGAGLMGANGVRKMVIELARAMKQQRPEVPDEQILKAAEMAVKMKMGGG